MTSKFLSEVIQLQKTAGIVIEGKEPGYGGSDHISDHEFKHDGKEYIADLDVYYSFDWDSEDGVYHYGQEVEVKELGEAKGDEYVPVTDRNEISKVEMALNSDPTLSRDIERQVDTSEAEPFTPDTYDGSDLDEDSDYDMGTPSGDTDAMNIGEGKKKIFRKGDKVKYQGKNWIIFRASGSGLAYRLKSLEGLPPVEALRHELEEENPDYDFD